MRSFTPARRSRLRGNAIIEFALSFPLLVAIFAGTFEFGYSFYIYNKLQTAVRGAARYASILQYSGAGQAPSQAYLTAVKNYAASGDPALSTPPIVPGLTPQHIVVTVTMVGGTPRAVKVGISGYEIKSIFKNHSLNGKPNSNFRYEGRIAAL